MAGYTYDLMMKWILLFQQRAIAGVLCLLFGCPIAGYSQGEAAEDDLQTKTVKFNREAAFRQAMKEQEAKKQARIDSFKSLYARAKKALDDADYQMAAIGFQALRDEGLTFPAIGIGLASSLLRLGQIREANDALSSVLVQDATNPWALKVKGDISYTQKDFATAKNHYSQALENGLTHQEFYCDMGNVEFSMEGYGEAQKYYQLAMETDPQLARPYLLMGLLFYHQKKYEEALGEFQRAIELEPDNTLVKRGAAMIYLVRGTPDKAMEIYQTVIQERPDDYMSYLDVARSAALAEKYKIAEEALSDLHQRLPQDADKVSVRNTAIVLELLKGGAFPIISQKMQKLIEEYPQVAYPYYNLGLLQMAILDREAACKSLMEAKNLGFEIQEELLCK